MKIRRYMAKNTQEAILKVKMDLGNDALILNTRKVRQRGIFGIFAKPLVEVLAAIDEYNEKPSPRSDSPNTARRAQEAPRSEEKAAAPADDRTKAKEIIFDEKEEKIANLENKLNNMEDMLQKMFKEMQHREKESDTSAKSDSFTGLSKAAQIFFNNLVKNEVEADIVKRILESLIAKVGVEAGANEIVPVLYGIISGLLGKPETLPQSREGRPTTAIFVGPTGVGKTTTLAKIAANYLLNQKKSVGLITADTYRIAAVEQLKTYAEILGIPVSVVYSPSEIQDAINRHSDKDLILIDTAGRSHRNKAQFEEMKSLITASGADEVYLVLSATTSARNCREILSSYDFLKNYKLIFTKTDETPVMGIVLNVRYHTGKNLSYITTGQSVPDDIETANIDKITKNLIGSIG